MEGGEKKNSSWGSKIKDLGAMKKFCKSWNPKKQLMLTIFNSEGIIFLAEMDMLFTLSTQIMKTAASKLSISFKLSA